jgi:hypothetical protein
MARVLLTDRKSRIILVNVFQPINSIFFPKKVNLSILRVIVILHNNIIFFFNSLSKLILNCVSSLHKFFSDLIVKLKDIVFCDMNDILKLEDSFKNFKESIFVFLSVHLPYSEQSHTDKISLSVCQDGNTLLAVIDQVFLHLPEPQSQRKPYVIGVPVFLNVLDARCLLVYPEPISVLYVYF